MKYYGVNLRWNVTDTITNEKDRYTTGEWYLADSPLEAVLNAINANLPIHTDDAFPEELNLEEIELIELEERDKLPF